MEHIANTNPPSDWVQRWEHLIRPNGKVLDIACGHGRHMQFLAARGHQVLGLDRSSEALNAATAWGEVQEADIENAPWPLVLDGQPRQFDAVVVTNYLWRALFPVMQASLAPGGVLIYETFAAGNETVGKPSRPDFLLQTGELLRAFAELRVVAFEDGFIQASPRFVQRLVAVKAESSLATNPTPTRHPL
jgi:SAM-dependent methyltransferase